ncbi:MAG: Type II secretion system protein E [Candidatus Omnitrophica bacterium ADurb.Bin292]|nr:MAG: Type II secretion system protein E [Candidatus Omnitrophica bacterium ADurb.Bin292]
MPFVSLSEMKIPEEVLDLVAPSSAEVHRAIPCERSADGAVVVAVADLENLSALDDLRYRLGVDVTGALTTDEEIERILEKYYRKKQESLDELLNDLKKLRPEEVRDEAESGGGPSHGPVVKLLELVLVQAIKDRASDVHFEPFEDNFKIRYRVDGSLYELVPPPKQLAPAIASRIKVMAGLKIAERRLPQDGRITARIAGRQVDLRVSTLPTVFGESVVVRILDRESVKLDLNALGLEQDLLDEIAELILRPNGIILVTGPTGCGKTTTLYACLQQINTIDSKCITTEEPVEYDIEGVVQVPINETVGLTFARSLRAILRQDPDRIMVGEIRDLETTQIAIQASLTGHCVVEDRAFLSGMTGFHQFTRIGMLAMVSALSAFNKDIPPFVICGGRPGVAQGINVVGMRRAGIGPEVRKEIKESYRLLYRSGLNTTQAIEAIKKSFKSPEVAHFVKFIETSRRGIIDGSGAVADTIVPRKNQGAGAGESADDDLIASPDV